MTRIIDLSVAVDEDAPEPFPVKIHRIGHEQGAARVGRVFIYNKTDPWHLRLKKLLRYVTGKRRIDGSSFPDGQFLSHETVTASVHCGTHVDSPFHFGKLSGGEPAKTIDELPLEWCYGDAVVLDMSKVPHGSDIGPEQLAAGLEETGYSLRPGDIVLIRTGADAYIGKPEYFFRFAGLSGAGVEYLLDKGVRTIGTDAASLDRPFSSMVEDYYRTKDGRYLWPAHIVGRDKEYCHIERLGNLDKLPRPYGFKFACFPVKIKDAGAAWARAVAIFDE